jgi:hypothetical protein
MEINLSDLSRSYPFLDLSRRLQLGYGAVLQIADKIDRGQGNKYLIYDMGVWNAVLAICRAPWRWQYPPEGRGL